MIPLTTRCKLLYGVYSKKLVLIDILSKFVPSYVNYLPFQRLMHEDHFFKTLAVIIWPVSVFSVVFHGARFGLDFIFLN